MPATAIASSAWSAAAVAPERGEYAERHAEADREREGEPAEGQADRQPGRDQVVDAEVPEAHRRPQVAVREAAEVAQVLLEERPVEAVGAIEVGLHLRRERLFLVERPARREAHQHEGKRHDRKQRRHGAGDPPERVPQQRARRAGRAARGDPCLGETVERRSAHGGPAGGAAVAAAVAASLGERPRRRQRRGRRRRAAAPLKKKKAADGRRFRHAPIEPRGPTGAPLALRLVVVIGGEAMQLAPEPSIGRRRA